jgi:hypothetical protein
MVPQVAPMDAHVSGTHPHWLALPVPQEKGTEQ